MEVTVNKKNKKRKLSSEQKEINSFKNKIKNVFMSAGFSYINTRNKHFKIGNRIIELDLLFYYENIVLICEDTTSTKKDKDHIRKKKEAFNEIENNKKEFLHYIYNTYKQDSKELKKYTDIARIKFYFLYFSMNQLDISEEERELYNNIIFVEPQSLNYFYRMSQCIQKSTRYEIFKFLRLKNEDIGLLSNETSKKVIEATIIYPTEFTGLNNGVRIVSFMMSAESLLRTSYVMRKDNWEDSIWFYQRLIDKTKIKKIREFIINKGQAFYNNIIVGLPDNIRFCDLNENTVDINSLSKIQPCKMEIPDEFNSICVIDGQHRIFAHYEGNKNDKNELLVKNLRGKLHLLVTGLIFPEGMSVNDRMRIQSEIFLDINSNAKPVQADVLLHIESIKDPLSDVGLARQVIVKLNKKQVFLNKFALSSLDQGKIKVASIIKFALRYLVTINPIEGKESFFTYWSGDKIGLLNRKDEPLASYIDFCVYNLELYFKALKNNFISDWLNPESKLLSVISINGFIIAYNRKLKEIGIQDYNFFNERFSKLKVDFSKENFPFTSSQYRLFSDQIIKQLYEVKEDLLIETM